MEQTLQLRVADEENQKAEYWRKLYVAMTRAEDELYVTGALTPGRDAGRQLEGSWYEAIEQALRDSSEVLKGDDGEERALVYPAGLPTPAISSADAVTGAPAEAASELPPLPAHEDRIVVKPSSAHAEAEIDRSFETALEAAASVRSGGTDREAARREGLALHALLQHLGKVAREDWTTVLEKAMPVLLPDAPERHSAIAGRALSLLESRHPEISRIFGPDSRAEVPFLLNARRNGKPVRIAGRIDRLVVSEDEVLVVDFKSDAHPPADSEGVPQGYLTQLGLYALVATQLFPAHTVSAAILWTSMESLMNLSSSRLAKAIQGFTVE